MRRVRTSGLWAVVVILLSGATGSRAQSPLEVGEVRGAHAESPHPYPAGRSDRPMVWRDTISSAGAAFLRLRFRGFALAPGDYVTVSNPDGSDFWTYRDRGPKGTGSFWSFALSGDTAIVEIHAGPRSGHGYRIDAIGHGSVDLRRQVATPEVQCGTDGREDVACHSPELDAAHRPVARLLFVSGGSLYMCTGWLVDGSSPSTLMTNNHCIARQDEVDTLQAKFNYQHTTCGGATTAITADYGGGSLLRTNSLRKRRGKGGLDYTLLTLDGNPEASWGELVPSATDPSLDDLIWLIQHPGGGVKQVGYWEDAAHTTRCGVDEVGQSYSDAAPGSQIGYACDTQGGSSGSPVVDEASGRVIAIHHLGNVSGACLNAGTAMSHICDDAGSLLHCSDGAPGDPPPSCNLGQRGDPCSLDADCCSGKCRGKRGDQSCR